MPTCIHGKAPGDGCARCEALTWTYTLTDQELVDARDRAFGVFSRAQRLGAAHHAGFDGKVVPAGDLSQGVHNHLVGAVGEWGAAGALDLPRPDPLDLEGVNKPDLEPDLDVKATTRRDIIATHGLLVNAQKGKAEPKPYRAILAGVRLPRTVVCLGWAAPEDLTPARYRPAWGKFAVPFAALRPMRDLHRALLEAGHARRPF